MLGPWYLSFRYFRLYGMGRKTQVPAFLVIFLLEKLRPRPLGNFPQFP
jgi:hypothetical protein